MSRLKAEPSSFSNWTMTDSAIPLVLIDLPFFVWASVSGWVGINCWLILRRVALLICLSINRWIDCWSWCAWLACISCDAVFFTPLWTPLENGLKELCRGGLIGLSVLAFNIPLAGSTEISSVKYQFAVRLTTIITHKVKVNSYFHPLTVRDNDQCL